MWIEYYIKKFVNFLLDFKWMHFILTSYPAINCYFDVSKVQQQTWGKVRESKGFQIILEPSDLIGDTPLSRTKVSIIIDNMPSKIASIFYLI